MQAATEKPFRERTALPGSLPGAWLSQGPILRRRPRSDASTLGSPPPSCPGDTRPAPRPSPYTTPADDEGGWAPAARPPRAAFQRASGIWGPAGALPPGTAVRPPEPITAPQRAPAAAPQVPGLRPLQEAPIPLAVVPRAGQRRRWPHSPELSLWPVCWSCCCCCRRASFFIWGGGGGGRRLDGGRCGWGPAGEQRDWSPADTAQGAPPGVPQVRPSPPPWEDSAGRQQCPAGTGVSSPGAKFAACDATVSLVMHKGGEGTGSPARGCLPWGVTGGEPRGCAHAPPRTRRPLCPGTRQVSQASGLGARLPKAP